MPGAVQASGGLERQPALVGRVRAFQGMIVFARRLVVLGLFHLSSPEGRTIWARIPNPGADGSSAVSATQGIITLA